MGSWGADRALVITDLDGGGAQRVLVSLAHRWVEAGLKVVVITLAGAGSDALRLDSRVRRIALDLPGQSTGFLDGLANNVRRIRALRRALRQSGARRVASFIGTTNVLTIVAAWGLGKRVVISERNDPSRQRLDGPWDILRRLVYGRADVVTANSRNAIDAMRAFVPEHKLAFVPNPVDVPIEAEPGEARERFVLAVGRLHPQKAYDVLLPAFARSQARLRDWRLVVLGDGARRAALAELASRLGIDDLVEWRGHVSDPVPWYRRAGVFVMPSRHEGTPNALLEAVACGAPAIVSDACEGALGLLEHERSCLVVPVGDAAALASALDRLIDDPALARRIADEARQRVWKAHDPSTVWRAWERALGGD